MTTASSVIATKFTCIEANRGYHLRVHQFNTSSFEFSKRLQVAIYREVLAVSDQSACNIQAVV
jgi:hypothetical protein